MNVVEVDGTASPAIASAATSVAAFVGLTERGPVNRPARLTSLAQFRDRFGSHRSDGAIGYTLEGFFLNGGTTAYISRVTGAGSQPSTGVLRDRQATAAEALRITAGYLGEADPGSWGKRLRIDLADDPCADTRLAADTEPNATGAILESVDGVRSGSVLRLRSGNTVIYRKVTAVDPQSDTVRWETSLPSVLTAASTTLTTSEFTLTVRFQARATADFTVVETWRRLSMEPEDDVYAVTVLNHPFSGSCWVMATDLTPTAAASGTRQLAVVANQELSAGGIEASAAAIDFLGDAVTGTGLHALDSERIQLLAVPDAHGLSEDGRAGVVRGALDYCAQRGDVCFVGSAPDRGRRPGLSFAETLTDYTERDSDYLARTVSYAQPFHGAKMYGALYSPWLQVIDPIGTGPAPNRFVPPEGHVMGVYARTDTERGIWKAPAGLGTRLRGVLDVAARFTDEQHTDLVRNGLVNGIRPTRGAGITVAASRTLSTDTRWWFVNVRLLFNFVKASLREGLRFVRQEPHTEQLRRMVRLNVVTPFLAGLWRQGAFGSDPAEDVFTVKCDAENNPATEVDQGNFRLEIAFYPVKPAETVLITVGQQSGGGSAGEA
ncbi:phage tail sheath family protein [Streptomyces sp. NPDC004980]